MFQHIPMMGLLSCLLLSTILAAIVLYLIVLLGRLRRHRDALLEEKQMVLNFVYDVSEVFAESDTVDMASLARRVVSYGLRVTSARAGALYLADSEGECLKPIAVVNTFPPLVGDLGNIREAFSKISHVEKLVRQRTIDAGEGLIGEVLSRGSPILILRIDSLLLVPMRFRHNVLGVLAVVNRTDGRPFSEADLNLLQALADQASVSIHYAGFGAALDEKRRMDYDLGIARRIQRSLLPKELPRIEGVQVGAFSVPAQQIGGDYYDVIRVDDEHLGIVIADVSGKGVPGAIVMSICRSLLRSEAPGCRSPAAVLRTVNDALSRDLSEDMFVSILYMILDTRTHELLVARGGHVHPILVAKGGGEARLIESAGMAMGVGTPELFDEALTERAVPLQPGQFVVAYTDGVTEAHDRKEQEWGILNLVQTIQAVAFDEGDAQAMAARVQEKLLQFTGDMPQYDDMTLVALRIAG